MSRRTNQSSSGGPERWLVHAESDLALVRLVDGHPDIRPELRCFHAQQAAEKALKSVLIARKVEFPLTHDLDVLLGIAQDAGIEVPDALMDLGRLTPYAVQTRYPGEWEDISDEELVEAAQMAEWAVAWARALVRSPHA